MRAMRDKVQRGSHMTLTTAIQDCFPRLLPVSQLALCLSISAVYRFYGTLILDTLSVV